MCLQTYVCKRGDQNIHIFAYGDCSRPRSYKLERKMLLAQNEIITGIYKGRTARLDFVGKDHDIIFNIEMNQKNSLERNNDYVGKLYSVEFREGLEKYDTVYQMNSNNFRLKKYTNMSIMSLL